MDLSYFVAVVFYYFITLIAKQHRSCSSLFFFVTYSCFSLLSRFQQLLSRYSGYLIATTGYFWLLLVTFCYFWFVVLVTTATKLFFRYYLRVAIILFSTDIYQSTFTIYSFGKTRFSSFYVLVFCVSVSQLLVFLFYVLKVQLCKLYNNK